MKMISKVNIIIVFLVVFIGLSSKFLRNFYSKMICCFFVVCKDNVKDRVCTFGGNAACRTYCFFTAGSVTGYCDANNDCICNSTITTSNNDGDLMEVDIYVINKWSAWTLFFTQRTSDSIYKYKPVLSLSLSILYSFSYRFIESV